MGHDLHDWLSCDVGTSLLVFNRSVAFSLFPFSEGLPTSLWDTCDSMLRFFFDKTCDSSLISGPLLKYSLLHICFNAYSVAEKIGLKNSFLHPSNSSELLIIASLNGRCTFFDRLSQSTFFLRLLSQLMNSVPHQLARNELNDSFIPNLHNTIVRLIVPPACNNIQYKTNNTAEQRQAELFFPNFILPSEQSSELG